MCNLNRFHYTCITNSHIPFVFSFFFLQFPIDCSDENQEINATENAWNSTTESNSFSDLTKLSDLDEIEDFTSDPTEGTDSATDDFDFDFGTKTTTTTNPPRSSRRKRHINFPTSSSGDNNAYTMEVMVAVDRKMQEYHGNNIQAYVLTLMSIVSNIYADASIGNSINVAVVHIFFLRDDLHIESNHIGKYC